MKTFSMKCRACGATMELDPNTAVSYCPYCGEKILLDIEQLRYIIAEKEKTRQVEIQENAKLEMERMRYEESRRDDKQTNGMIIGGFAVMIICAIICFLIYGP